jgi:hypothetical protein
MLTNHPKTVTEQNGHAVVALTVVPVVPEISLQGWADRINAKHRKEVSAIIEKGQELLAAKKAKPHGEWAKMFKGHPQAIANPVRFSVATAKMYMTIAEHPVLSNRYHGNDLPPSWRTLYELAHLDAPVLEAHLALGVVHAELTRAAATALLPAFDWRAHWKGMPEYISNDLTPWKTLKVHFRCQEDFQRFAQLIKQPLTTDTKSVGFPSQVAMHQCECGHVHEDWRTKPLNGQN